MKQLYRCLDDAEETMLELFPWLAEDEWARGENFSIFNLSDGSCFIIYEE